MVKASFGSLSRKSRENNSRKTATAAELALDSLYDLMSDTKLRLRVIEQD